jgi:hypothetical protein
MAVCVRVAEGEGRHVLGPFALARGRRLVWWYLLEGDESLDAWTTLLRPPPGVGVDADADAVPCDAA